MSACRWDGSEASRGKPLTVEDGLRERGGHGGIETITAQPPFHPEGMQGKWQRGKDAAGTPFLFSPAQVNFLWRRQWWWHLPQGCWWPEPGEQRKTKPKHDKTRPKKKKIISTWKKKIPGSWKVKQPTSLVSEWDLPLKGFAKIWCRRGTQREERFSHRVF